MAVSSRAGAPQAFELKSASLNLLALHLKTPDLAELAEAMQSRFGGSDGLFDQEPVCVDFSALPASDAAPDLAALAALLARHGLKLLAARGGSPAQMDAARAAGLVEADPAGPARTEGTAAPATAHESAPAAAPAPTPEPVPEPAPAAPVAAASRTVIIDKPLRSGQQVYARGADLIVMAVVSYGAEVIADGSIHVYAPLRGRAIAGAQGDTEARIFAAVMEPQLVSIAGTWRNIESGLPPEVAGKPAQVRLEGDSLRIEPLKF
jgi:septum site-determining protein MinC